MKSLTDSILRLTSGAATEAELRAMEEILGDVGKEITKWRRQLSEDEHTYDAIQARYSQMIGAAERLEQRIEVDPPNRAELETSLGKLTNQIEAIALELGEDSADAEEARSLLAEMEAAYQQKMQELAQAKAYLQRAKVGVVGMSPGKGDLTMSWDGPRDAEIIEHIQALMDKGVTFHPIDTVEKGKIRKRRVTTATPIASTDQIQDRRLLITDAEIKKRIPTTWDLCQNLGLEPPPPPDGMAPRES